MTTSKLKIPETLLDEKWYKDQERVYRRRCSNLITMKVKKGNAGSTCEITLMSV